MQVIWRAVPFMNYQEKENAFMVRLLSSENPRMQVTAIRAMRVAYKHSDMKDRQKIFDDLEKATESDSIKVKTEVMEALLDFYGKDPKRSKVLIEGLAWRHVKCRYSLVVRISCHSPFDEEADLHFLEICSEDSDINVKKMACFMHWSNLVKRHPDKVLEVLAKMCHSEWV